MLNMFIILNNYRTRYLVTFIDGNQISAYRHDLGNFKEPFLVTKASETYIVKDPDCENSGYDSNTILVGGDDNEYFFWGFEINKFSTEGEFVDFINFMSNSMTAFSIDVGEKYTYFIPNHCKLIEDDKVEEGTLLNESVINNDPYAYHLANCGAGAFKTVEYSRVHTYYLNKEEDDVDEVLVEEQEHSFKPDYCNGNNEMVKHLFQESVLSFEKPSGYALRQSWHQCVCENCNQNKSDVDISKV